MLAAAILVASAALLARPAAALSWSSGAAPDAVRAHSLRAAPWAADPNAATSCFEEDCRSSPFMMHASRAANASDGGRSYCFKFVAIGCYAAPKGCCPAVARRFSGLSFDASE